MVKGTDREDFERLQKLGFKFDDPIEKGDNADLQPDSSGLIGGIRGAQEYGIDDPDEITDPEDFNRIIDPLNEDPDVIPDPEPFPYNTSEPIGASEWSTDNALNEEEIVEQLEVAGAERRERKERRIKGR